MKSFFATLITTLAIIGSALGKTATVNGVTYSYMIMDGQVVLLNDCQPVISTKTSLSLIIPSTIGGYPVTVIGAAAVRDCNRLSNITIPESVTLIGQHAFS